MKYVRLSFLSVIVKRGIYYAHLGETRGKRRRLLLTMDQTAGMWMERHLSRGGTSGKFSNNVGFVQLKKEEGKALHGKIYYGSPNADEPVLLKASYALLCAYNNKCAIRMEDEQLEALKLGPDELQFLLPDPKRVLVENPPSELLQATHQKDMRKKLMAMLEQGDREVQMKHLKDPVLDGLLILKHLSSEKDEFKIAADRYRLWCSFIPGSWS